MDSVLAVPRRSSKTKTDFLFIFPQTIRRGQNPEEIAVYGSRGPTLVGFGLQLPAFLGLEIVGFALKCFPIFFPSFFLADSY